MNNLRGALSRIEAADYLSVSLRTVDSLLAKGKLKRTKIGRKTVIRILDLDEFLANSVQNEGE